MTTDNWNDPEPVIGPGVNPRTNAVEENADEVGSRFSRAQGGRALHAGMTRAERVAAGHGLAEDMAAAEKDNEAHRRYVKNLTTDKPKTKKETQ